MPDFPINHGAGFSEIIDGGASATSSASTNTKGSYVEIIASTAREYDWLLLTIDPGAVGRSGLVDLAIGGAGAEQIILANYLSAGRAGLGASILIPRTIPAGSRIAARSQNTVGSTSTRIAVVGGVGGFWRNPDGGTIETFGAVTATSRGTALDAGASAGTYGSWVQLTASTTTDIAALMVEVGAALNSAPTGISVHDNNGLQIGVGAAASEVPIIALPYTVDSNGTYGPLPSHWHSVSIPAGSRIAARVKMNTTDATDRILDVVVHALTI